MNNPTPDAPEAELLARITNYLGNGGLFNPEHMEHDKVRDLIMDCRDALKDLDAVRKLVNDSIDVFTNVAQVLDGWHNDGTAWSEWDEQVRKDVTGLLKRIYSLKQPNTRTA